MATSVGTAWIQIKPSLSGVSNDIKKALGDSGAASSQQFGNQFKSSFLLAAKQSFAEGFGEFGRRTDAAFSQFKTAAAVGFAAVSVGVLSFAKQLDSAAGSQKSFIANMTLAGQTNEETAKTFKLLQDYANQSIYSLTEMTSTAGILASTGVKDAGVLVRAFGNMAAAAENPAQAIRSMSQQMAQVNGKGFVQTMDFRIMQEQAAGPMKLVTDKLRELNNWSMADFQKALSEGSISAEMLNKAMISVGENQTLNELATKPRTIADAWEALTSTLVSNLATSDSWAKIQQKVVGWIVKGSEWISKNQDTIEKWIDTVLNAAKSAVDWVRDNQELVLMILKVVVAFKALQLATGAVRSVFDTLSPYGKILKGTFELAIGGAQTLIGKFKGLSDASKSADTAAGGIDKLSESVKRAPKTFAFGESIASFFKNIGQALSGAANAVIAPLQTLAKGAGQILTTVLTAAGEAIAGFLKALANPQLLLGALVFAAASLAVALAIWAIGSAVGAVTPGLADFLNSVIIPLGTFLLTVFIGALFAVTTAIIALTNLAIIPLVNAVSGGLTSALHAISGVINAAGGAISGVVTSIADGIAKVINSVANLLRSVGGQDWYGTGYGITRNFTAGLIDGLIDLMQDSLNKIINNIINIPGIGEALKSIGVKANPVNLSGFKLGRRAAGGSVFGPGGPTSDSIPMALSNGEYVIRTAAARKIGYGNLDQLNATGTIGGSFTMGDIIIQGYNKDPKELADEISKEIALRRKRVVG